MMNKMHHIKQLLRSSLLLAGVVVVMTIGLGGCSFQLDQSPTVQRARDFAQRINPFDDDTANKPKIQDDRTVGDLVNIQPINAAGVDAWLVHDDTVPVVSVRFSFDGGAVTDPDGLTGRANLMAQMLTEGASTRTAEQFKKELADNAIRLSYSTGYDRFYGQLTTTTGRLDTAIELTRDSLLSPRLDEDALLRTKAAILSQLSARRADPNYQAARALRRFGYAGHPYARPRLGTPDSLAKITASDLVQFGHNHLTKDKIKVAIVGDVSYFQARRILSRLFGQLPDNGVELDIASTALTNTDQLISVKRNGAQSVMVQAFNGLQRKNPDWYAATVLNHILGGGDFSSRLMQDLRSDKGWTYGISSSLRPAKYAPHWIIRSSLQPQNIKATTERIKFHMTRLQNQGPTKSEVEAAIEYLTGSFVLEFSSTESIADILLTIQIYDLGLDYLDQRDDLYRQLTQQKIQQVAKDYLRPDDMITVVTGPDTPGITPDISAKTE